MGRRQHHVTDGFAFYEGQPVLCGKPLVRDSRRDSRGRVPPGALLSQTITVIAYASRAASAFGRSREALISGFCPECVRLASMPEAERTEAIAAREAAKHDRERAAFEGLKAKRAAKRAAQLAERDARIARAREDAVPVLDAYLLGTRLRRCMGLTRHPVDETVTHERRCVLAQRHDGPCTHVGEPAPDITVVLGGALDFYRAHHPRSRGDRLWVFEGDRVNGRHVKVPLVGRALCRFCRIDLGPVRRGQTTIGTRGDEHTIVCALRYLLMMPLERGEETAA